MQTDQIQLECRVERVTLTDLGITLLKGSRAWISREQAIRSNDLKFFVTRGMVVTHFIRPQVGVSPPPPAKLEGVLNAPESGNPPPSHNPPPEVTQPKPIVEAISEPVGPPKEEVTPFIEEPAVALQIIEAPPQEVQEEVAPPVLVEATTPLGEDVQPSEGSPPVVEESLLNLAGEVEEEEATKPEETKYSFKKKKRN